MPDTIQLIRGVRQQIASRLRDEILSGRFAEGERLSETSLARRFGVSRGPIREVFVQLTQEGLLIAKPNCGVTVAHSAPESLQKLITPIRRTIEVYALDLIYDELTEGDFAALEGIVERLRLAWKNGDGAATVEADIALHRFLLERAGQPDLLAIWSTIVVRIRRYILKLHSFDHSTLKYAYTQHRDLVDVLRAGNKRAALRALEEHIF